MSFDAPVDNYLGTGAAGTGSLPPIAGASQPFKNNGGAANLFIDDSLAGGRLNGIGFRNQSPLATNYSAKEDDNKSHSNPDFFYQERP